MKSPTSEAARGREYLRELMAKCNARKAWEAAHPELASAWSEAIREDYRRMMAAEREAAERDARGKIGGRLRQMGCPSTAIEAIERGATDTPALKAAKEWAAGTGLFLLLLGGVGTGKTVAAVWALGRHMARASLVQRPSGGAPRDDGLWVTAPELASAGSFGEDGEWLRRVERCGLLVLDDLGAESLNAHAQGQIARVLCSRHAAGRRTVITSNLGLQEVEDRYGARVLDRIRESGRVLDTGKGSLRRRAS